MSAMLSAKELAAVLPVLIPAGAAALLPIATLDRDQATVKWVRGAIFCMALVGLAGSFLYVSRLWSSGLQPVYGPIRMDRLAQFAGLFVLVAAALAVLQLWDHLHQEGWVKGETLALLLASVAGMMLFAATTDLVLLFVALELLSLPLYALTGTLRSRPESLEGAMKYFMTGAVASACFLMGAVLLYGLTGSFDLAVIGSRAALADPLALAGAGLLLVGFFFKVSAVPFHQWTPDAYEAAPHPIAAFMSVATKGVAFIALLRVFAEGLGQAPALGARLQSAAALLAVLTLVLANLSALVQVNVKRMLAYSSIGHAGYLLLAFVAGTRQAYVGLVFYLAAYLAMNLGAFGLLSALGLVGGRTEYQHLRGQGWKRPGVALAATLCLLSLAGIPPTGGFFGKYLIFKELIRTGHVGLAVLAVLASLVSVAYYLKIVVALYQEAPSVLQEREEAERPDVVAPVAGGTVLVCGGLSLLLGLLPGLVTQGLAFPVVRDALGLLP